MMGGMNFMQGHGSHGSGPGGVNGGGGGGGYNIYHEPTWHLLLWVWVGGHLRLLKS